MRSVFVSRAYIAIPFLFLSGLGILSQSFLQENRQTPFKPYTAAIPGTMVKFDMVAIPGGQMKLGSSASQKGHQPDEAPVHEVKIDAFWMGKFEVTWDEYELFISPELEKLHQKNGVPPINKEVKVDGVARPTPPFTDMSFGMGKNGLPAVNMTYYAALSYCKWLTDKTGHFYRLPTEAEWEYACRAGSDKAYSFGDDEQQLGEYAWYSKNSGGAYHKPGQKKPNIWGLYDMHGNVAEWTLDQYIPDYYTGLAKSVAVNPWAQPEELYPHSVRGGSWNDNAELLRSASRQKSARRWKRRDPQIPKSDWWMTDASFVGFRVVRPAKTPTAAEIQKYFSGPIEDL